MEPFQVNCSELIADFQVKADEDVREIVKRLTETYQVELYFEFLVQLHMDKRFSFQTNRDLMLEVDGVSFEVSVVSENNYETWMAKLVNSSDLTKLIERIEKIKLEYINYDLEIMVASHPLARALRDRIIMQLPNYQTEFTKEWLEEIVIDDFIELELKLVSGQSETKLKYEESMGWYFILAEYCQDENYAFFEWAEKEYQAEIGSFDEGRTSRYKEFLQNEQRERLEPRR